MDKKTLSETDIITKFVLPAVNKAGWSMMSQIQYDPEELLSDYAQQQQDIQKLRDQLKDILNDALTHKKE